MPLQTLLVSNAKDLWLIALQVKVLSSAGQWCLSPAFGLAKDFFKNGRNTFF
jgi:hypothetical protein